MLFLSYFNRIKTRWYLLAIFVLGLTLRLINIRAEPYWGDEVLSLQISRHFSSIAQILAYLREVEFHPPLYYITLHYWIGWFGQGTLATRSLSVIFGLGVIGLTYVLGKRMFKSERIALVSAFAIAVLPLQVEFGQEARPYIIICFFGLLSLLALWEYLNGRKIRWLLVYCLSSLIGIYFHYSFLFFFAGLASFWFIYVCFNKQQKRGQQFLLWLGANSIIFLGFGFWLSALLYKLFLSQFSIFGLSRQIVADRNPGFFEIIFDQLIWLTKFNTLPATLIFIKLLVKLSFLGMLLYVVRNKWDRIKQQSYFPVLFLLWIIVVPLVLFLFSMQSMPYTEIIVKHIIPITIPIVLLAVWLFSLFENRIFFALSLVFFISLIPFTANIVQNDATWDSEYQLQTAGEYIDKNYQPGDLLIISSAIFRPDLTYFLKPEIPIASLLPINYYGLDFWNSRDTLGFIENEYQTRIVPVTNEEIRLKLNNLFKIYRPKRVWLYGFKQSDSAVHDWFYYQNWRQGFRSIADVFLLDMYAKN